MPTDRCEHDSPARRWRRELLRTDRKISFLVGFLVGVVILGKGATQTFSARPVLGLAVTALGGLTGGLLGFFSSPRG